MDGKYVFTGIGLMIGSVGLPILYFILDIFSLGILTVITLGFDWICCCSVSGLAFTIGLVLMIVGLVKHKDRK